MKKTDTKWQTEIQEALTSGLMKANIEIGSRYLVGVSGGKDSVSLVHLLRESKIDFAIAHLNHCARTSADRDQEFVQNLGDVLGLKVFTETINVPLIAQNEKLSFEEAARIKRYRFLMRTAEKNDYAGVIVGHHADDQVETVLMHLLRGSGIAGLAGMMYREINPSFSETIPILRPLLGLWGEDIERYCQEWKLDFVEDESNSDVNIYRNRLRHELLPLLAEYNPGVKKHFWQTSMISQETLLSLEYAQEQAWKEILHNQEDALVAFHLQKFIDLETGLQKLLIRQAVNQLMPDMRNFGYELTLKTLELINHPPEGGQWQIIGDIFGHVHQDELLIGYLEKIQFALRKPYPQWQNDEMKIEVKGDITLDLDDQYQLVFQTKFVKNVKGKPWLNSETDEAWFDADRIEWPLILRAFREGDRIEPLGMQGQTMKVSDYFINQKIPQPSRQNYPLLCDQKGILWIIGERMAEGCKVTSKTTRILTIRLVQKNPN